MAIVVLGGVALADTRGDLRPVGGQQGEVLALLVAAYPDPVGDD